MIRLGRTRSKLLATVALTMLGASGCSEIAFRNGILTQGPFAPGHFQVPAKLDLMMVQDNTGSWQQAFDAVQAEMPQFREDLEAGGWDYRFASTLLVPTPGTGDLWSRVRPIRSGLVSKFDPIWAQFSLWQPPFPGALVGSLTGIPSQYFAQTSNFQDFVTTSDINYQLNQTEPGFATIFKTLENSPWFARPDAQLAILVIGNGNDTSGFAQHPNCPTITTPTFEQRWEPNLYCMVNYHYGDGWQPRPGETLDTFNHYLGKFQGLVANGVTQRVRLYSAVAKTTVRENLNNCLGSVARQGGRYMQMSQALGSPSFDLCSGASAVRNLFEDLKTQLHNERIAMESHYLILPQEPSVESIQVIRAEGGVISQATLVPEDSENGWTYIGQRTVFQISAPVELNQVTGFVIELHGSAILHGDDQAQVFYKPVGATN